MKPKLYIDTSVINGLFADDEPWIKEVTRSFFERIAAGRYRIYISNEVDREIRATLDEDKRALLLGALAKYDFKRLERTQECDELADVYMKQRVFPRKYRGDALHVAIATVYGLEAMVSWNFSHIVRHSTRLKVNEINDKKGYPRVDVCSPEEV